MKNIIRKITCVGLVGLMVVGFSGVDTTEAEIIKKGNKTYIGYDTIERDENLEVIKYLGIKNAKAKYDKKTKTYTVEFKSNKNCKETKKLVEKVAKKIHGTEIEKLFNEYRTYNVRVKSKDKKGHIHIYTINGHKVK